MQALVLEKGTMSPYDLRSVKCGSNSLRRETALPSAHGKIHERHPEARTVRAIVLSVRRILKGVLLLLLFISFP